MVTGEIIRKPKTKDDWRKMWFKVL
jgi:hypothetical protein